MLVKQLLIVNCVSELTLIDIRFFTPEMPTYNRKMESDTICLIYPCSLSCTSGAECQYQILSSDRCQI